MAVPDTSTTSARIKRSSSASGASLSSRRHGRHVDSSTDQRRGRSKTRASSLDPSKNRKAMNPVDDVQVDPQGPQASSSSWAKKMKKKTPVDSKEKKSPRVSRGASKTRSSKKQQANGEEEAPARRNKPVSRSKSLGTPKSPRHKTINVDTTAVSQKPATPIRTSSKRLLQSPSSRSRKLSQRKASNAERNPNLPPPPPKNALDRLEQRLTHISASPRHTRSTIRSTPTPEKTKFPSAPPLSEPEEDDTLISSPPPKPAPTPMPTPRRSRKKTSSPPEQRSPRRHTSMRSGRTTATAIASRRAIQDDVETKHHIGRSRSQSRGRRDIKSRSPKQPQTPTLRKGPVAASALPFAPLSLQGWDTDDDDDDKNSILNSDYMLSAQ